MTQEKQAKKFQAIKGVRDILPPESALWNRVEQIAREVFTTYNFGEIRLPIFEQTELFARSVGADTDIVSKEMYTFADRGLDRVEAIRSYLERQLPHQNYSHIAQFFIALVNEISVLVEGEQLASVLPGGVTLQELDAFSAGVQKLANAPLRPEDDAEKERLISRIGAYAQTLRLGDMLTLRPEATASVVRAYIEHGMHTLPGNVKLYYIGPMFRRERPQKGRYRQFYQIGAEVLGQSDSPNIDAEVIEMLMTYLERLGLTGTTLYVNSIGCKDCRPAYVAKLREELLKVKDQLGADSQRRIETNPLRVLDSKVESEQAVIEKLPRIADHLCDACRAHFSSFQEQLKQRGIAYEINWRLVRGLDYYMRTTFEITAPGLGAQNAICGGGRYDGLVELLGGPPTKGIGFAIGTDRLVLSLQEVGAGNMKAEVRKDVTVHVPGTALKADVGKVKVGGGVYVFIAWMGTASYPTAVKLARRLRGEGFLVELPAEEMKFKKSLGLADKLGARYAVIIGEDEVASGQFTLKRLADAEQKKLSEAELLSQLIVERNR